MHPPMKVLVLKWWLLLISLLVFLVVQSSILPARTLALVLGKKSEKTGLSGRANSGATFLLLLMKITTQLMPKATMESCDSFLEPTHQSCKEGKSFFVSRSLTIFNKDFWEKSLPPFFISALKRAQKVTPDRPKTWGNFWTYDVIPRDGSSKSTKLCTLFIFNSLDVSGHAIHENDRLAEIYVSG